MKKANQIIIFCSKAHLFDQYFHLCATFAVIALIGVYLWFVLKFGPEFMKNRDPFNVVDLIRLYNAFQVVACTIFVVKAQQIGFSFKYLWKCEKFEFFSDITRLEVSIGYWLFLILRCIEFIETVFFVVRKKQSQATFLHIFHHIGSVLMTFLFIIMEAGETGRGVAKSFQNLINSTFFSRTYGDLYCNHQLVCTHGHVLILFLQLVPK